MKALETNASAILDLCHKKGIEPALVTKVIQAQPRIVERLHSMGFREFADSRIANLKTLRRILPDTHLCMLKLTTREEAARLPSICDSSIHSSAECFAVLNHKALLTGQKHGIVLILEWGDLREGAAIEDVEQILQVLKSFPHLYFRGFATNLGCYSGIIPDSENMLRFARFCHDWELKLKQKLLISAGNSSALGWLKKDASPNQPINHLRLGESVFLGLNPVNAQIDPDLNPNVFRLSAKIVEKQYKPSQPYGGKIGRNAFDLRPKRPSSIIEWRYIVSLGRMDTDPEGLTPPQDIEILGSSSDYLLLTSKRILQMNQEIHFGLNYSALMRSMHSPYVKYKFI